MPLAGKPISAYRRLTPLPDRWQPRGKGLEKPPLWHFVFLSMLLHALFISLFGAPSGGSREGRALWGALQVVSISSQPEPGPLLKLDRGVAMERLRELMTPRIEPPARAAPAAPKRRVEPVAPPRPAPRPDPSAEKLPFSMPPVLDRILAPDRKLKPPPALQVPTPTEIQSVRPPAPVIPVPAPPPPVAPVAPEPPPRIERAPEEAPPIVAPLVPPVPLPVPERLATPPLERAPVEAPVVPAISSTPPVERAPVEVPAIPVPALESVAPVRVEPAPQPVERARVEEMPAAPKLPDERPQVREAPPRVDREPPAEAPPVLRPSPLRSPELPGDSIRRGPEEPATKYDPTAPVLDLDAMRRRASSIAREGTGNRAVLPFPMPPMPERKTKEQIAIENARKPDCKTAYQSLGLAAIVPLIANEFGEGNCRW